MKERENLNVKNSPLATDAGRHKPPLEQEAAFHDAWAKHEDVSQIDIRNANESCTAPELRYVHKKLGNIAGRKILDVGCGRGETSVYFALKGADVTALDVSPGMLELTAALARRHRTSLHVHQADIQNLGFDPDVKFDIIHAANVLHHVDIAQALPRMLAHLAPRGTFISWDPIVYNPVINVYRRLARAVRTEDEHPLTRSDVQKIAQQFRRVETRWYWLTTLIIFVIMATWQRRNPNKQRFWKAVVQEGNQWAWIYRPLARVDDVLLRLLPLLRWWCWNVVIVGQEPICPLAIENRSSSPPKPHPEVPIL